MSCFYFQLFTSSAFSLGPTTTFCPVSAVFSLPSTPSHTPEAFTFLKCSSMHHYCANKPSMVFYYITNNWHSRLSIILSLPAFPALFPKTVLWVSHTLPKLTASQTVALLFLIDNFKGSSQFPIFFDLSAVYNWPLFLASITSFSWHDSALPWLFSYICKSLLFCTLSLSFSVLHVPDCGWSTGPAFNTPVLQTPFLLEWSHL